VTELKNTSMRLWKLDPVDVTVQPVGRLSVE